MTTRLQDLQPGTGPIPIEVLRELPLGGIYHFTEDSGASEVFGRILEWGRRSGSEIFRYSWFHYGIECGDGYSLWALPENVPVRYPTLPRVSFAKTTEEISTPGDQPSGRCKSITRRKPRRGCPVCQAYVRPARKDGKIVPGRFVCRGCGPFKLDETIALPPAWAKVGRLFLAIDQQRRSRKRPASRGLGVFRVTSAEMRGRWRCPECGGASKPWNLTHHRQRLCEDPACAYYDKKYAFDTITPEELRLEGLTDMAPDDFWKLLVDGGAVDHDGNTCRIAFKEAT